MRSLRESPLPACGERARVRGSHRLNLSPMEPNMRGQQPWRSRPISAEAKLWEELRDRRFSGHKFVRQAPVGPYFADFLCRDKKVIVEVDGGTHGTGAEIADDTRRTARLRRLGYRVLRVTNGDVYDNFDGVLDELLALIESAHS
jgi:very-short-patch-repair endonuclease